MAGALRHLTNINSTGSNSNGGLNSLTGPSQTALDEARSLLMGALWNASMEAPPAREHTAMGQALLPLLMGGQDGSPTWPLLRQHDEAVIVRTATCLFHLCNGAPVNSLEQLRESFWEALELPRLNDDACSHLMQVGALVLDATQHHHGTDNPISTGGACRAITLLTSPQWASSRKPREAWQRSRAAEVLVLLRASICAGTAELLLDSGALRPDGSAYEALVPTGCQHGTGAAIRLAGHISIADGGRLRQRLASQVLDRLLNLVENVPHALRDDLVCVLHGLSREPSVAEASTWVKHIPSLITLAEWAAQKRRIQSLACALELLTAVVPRRADDREQAWLKANLHR
eukprot:CAMPEP_0172911206 /NCGR_PEP_ID=MMETSP1075-20121228/186058_1 /TAXON_ID=2916 /ORGANISM="Ceratium fusus, Strain PA161109" /LENGTH=345 /DNA_ID=CAMNT_0013769475 /DNA_START=26 /DNA_END=1060 /DNA_ORIENTATION=-